MLSLPKLSNRVHWSEGMLMSPQHFQQADVFCERLMAHQLQRLSRFYWGVIDVQMDELEFASNVISLTSLHCVFPDGTVVQFNGVESADESLVSGLEKVSLSLDELDLKAGETFTVSLAIARHSIGCASDDDSDLKRYHSVNEGQMADIGEVNSLVDVVRLHPVVRLVLEHKSSPNHSAFPVFKLEKLLDETYRLHEFTPPLLSSVSGYSAKDKGLWERLSRVLAKARLKAVELRSLLSDRRSEEVMLARQRQRIIGLTGRLLGLEARLEAESHPFDTYCSLVDYVSDLSSIREDPVPPNFRKYNHNDLDGTFGPVLDFVEETIESIRLDYSIIQFSIDDEQNFIGELSQRQSGDALLLSFQVPPGVSKDEAALWVEGAYICNQDDYDQLTINRDLGLERTRVQGYTSLNLIEGAGEILYQVNFTSGEPVTILISGSDLAMELSKPSMVLCFTGRAD